MHHLYAQDAKKIFRRCAPENFFFAGLRPAKKNKNKKHVSFFLPQFLMFTITMKSATTHFVTFISHLWLVGQLNTSCCTLLVISLSPNTL